MHEKQLSRFREIAQTIDGYLTRTFRDVDHPGPGDELQGMLDLLLPGDGRYVDIGANDPIQLSNTWGLHNRNWIGLLVEPDPACWPRLLRHRPGDYLWPTAVSDHGGTALLRADASGVSSIEADWACPAHAREVTVELVKTSDVLQMFSGIRNECRLCSIDVEGHEAAVIRGIDWTCFSPEVLIVESLRYDPVQSHVPLWPEWEPLLVAVDYVYWRQTSDGVNRIYLKRGSNAWRLAHVEVRANGAVGESDISVRVP